jgi:hypothetical protein
MFIERICPGLVPAIKEAFAMLSLVNVDDLVRGLLAFGDLCIVIGALLVVSVAFVASVGLDVVRFVRGQRARRKHAA